MYSTQYIYMLTDVQYTVCTHVNKCTVYSIKHVNKYTANSVYTC